MLKKLLEAITGDDNLTIEPAYLWGALAFLIGMGLEVWAALTGNPFDLQQFGIGSAALIAGLGLGKKLSS
jgi:uncharacterized membrane protein